MGEGVFGIDDVGLDVFFLGSNFVFVFGLKLLNHIKKKPWCHPKGGEGVFLTYLHRP